MNEKKFMIGLNIALILLWGLVTIFHLIVNHNDSTSVSFLLLYVCYVMSECIEIKFINEVDK